MHEAKPVNSAKVEPLWKVKHTVRIGQGKGWTCPICGRWEDGTGPCSHTQPKGADGA